MSSTAGIGAIPQRTQGNTGRPRIETPADRRKRAMRELMRAEWFRLVRSGVLLAAVGAAAALAAALALLMYQPELDFVAVGPGVPGAYLIVTGIISAIVCGLSAERDFYQGGIRNKLVVGHTRGEAYAASFLVNTAVSYMAAGAYLGVLYAGISGWADLIDPERMGRIVLEGLPAVAAFTAMYSLAGVLWQRRGAAAVCLAVFAGLMVLSAIIGLALAEPEFNVETYSPGMSYSGVSIGIEVRNPLYISGPARKVYDFILCFLPTGQADQLAGGEVQPFLPLYAAGFCAVCRVWGKMALDGADLR